MESSPNNQKLSESLVWDYMVDMLLGINHLHTYLEGIFCDDTYSVETFGLNRWWELFPVNESLL